MANKIQMKRGLSTNINSLTLSAGEPAFTTDTKKLYVGTDSSKELINDSSIGEWQNGTLDSTYGGQIKYRKRIYGDAKIIDLKVVVSGLPISNHPIIGSIPSDCAPTIANPSALSNAGASLNNLPAWAYLIVLSSGEIQCQTGANVIAGNYQFNLSYAV